MRRPKECPDHQNYKYMTFCPVCVYEIEIKKLREANKVMKDALEALIEGSSMDDADDFRAGTALEQVKKILGEEL